MGAKKSIFVSPTYQKVKLAILLLIPVVLLALPKTFFDSGQSICLSVVLLKTECFACGITRGVMHLIHLDFEEAFAYNMASFLVLPALVMLWLENVRQSVSKLKKSNSLNQS